MIPYIGKYKSIPITNAYIYVRGVQDQNLPKEIGVTMILDQSTMCFMTKCFVDTNTNS